MPDKTSNRRPRQDSSRRKVPVQQTNSAVLADLSAFLATLTDGPIARVHVNGVDHPMAVLTVDFGVPLKPGKMTPEQTQDLVAKMRHTTRDIVDRECRVGINNDATNGIWWTALS